MAEYRYKPNEKKQAYDIEYVRTHYDVFNIKMPLGMKDKIKAVAAKNGKSLNQFLIDLIKTQIKD